MTNASKNKLMKMGFTIKNDEIKDFNGNVYACIIVDNYDLLYSRDGCFYYYEDGVYQQMTDMEFKNMLMRDFDADAPNMWKPAYEKLYLHSFVIHISLYDYRCRSFYCGFSGYRLYCG